MGLPFTEELPSPDLIINACHPQDKEICLRIIDVVTSAADHVFQACIRVRERNGIWRWILISSRLFVMDTHAKHGTIVGIMIPLNQCFLQTNQFCAGRDMAKRLRSQEMDSLTNREKQILSLIARGHTCASIARELSLSYYTIDTYRKKLLKKLHVPNIAAMAALAGELGLR